MNGASLGFAFEDEDGNLITFRQSDIKDYLEKVG